MTDPFGRALRLALDLGARTAGEEHVLLAWVEHEQPEHVEGLRAALAGALGDGDRRAPDQGTMSGSSWHWAKGRAAGLALAGDRVDPAPDEVLRACVWDESGLAAAALRSLGMDRPTWAVASSGALSEAAEAEAVAAGDGFVGPCHVALAVLAGRPDGQAAAALAGCGVGHAALAARHADQMATCEPPPSRLQPGTRPQRSPACLQVLGCAEGLAACAGASTARSDHGVVAWLWMDGGDAIFDVEAQGASGPAVVAALAAADVAVPSVPLREPDRRPWGEPVDFPLDRLDDVLRHANRSLPAGDWGFNRSGDRAWLIAVAEVDLERLVGEVLSAD